MLRTSLSGSSFIGVYAEATDDHLFVRPDLDADLAHALADELETDAVETTVGGSTTVGALLAANSNGVVASSRIRRPEADAVSDATGVAVTELPGRINAAGNIILANDTGAVIHPDATPAARSAVADGLGVPVTTASVAGVKTIGTAAVATNKGVLCHPNTSDSQLDFLEDHLGVPADIGTINYGGALVGAGLIANTAGYVAGQETTGPELGRIEEALGFIE